MIKILVIVGPTASGKSDLAVRLALKFGGEIISADSRQVYRGLNIATGKITQKEMRSIPHHLLDVANPKKRFTVVQYQRLANKAIQDILLRGKLPIICGGTGFYIDAVINNVDFSSVKADDQLRAKLAIKPVVELLVMLQKLDPIRSRVMNKSDQKNPRRLIRAIEIAKILNKQTKMEGQRICYASRPAAEATNLRFVKLSTLRHNYEPIFIGLQLSATELKKRIRARTIARVRRGMIDEARRLHSHGLSFKRMREIGLEYKYLADFLENKINKKQLIEAIITKDWQYARRQMTWWKRNKKIKWYSLTNR